MAAKRLKRSERLLGVLDEFQETDIVMHNNPDPDAIATGWALLALIKQRLRKPARLLGRGPILRAENLQFVKLLQPPISLVDEICPNATTAMVLVDCSPGSANHLLGGSRAPAAVIDHHETKGDGFRIPFRDVRPKATASASIVAEYLREQGMEPTSQIATALLYAIRTEMIGAQVALSRLDHAALRWLSGFADYGVMSAIENPPLPRHYYEELLLGLDSVLVYADSAVCFLPRITGAEIIGETADLLIRCEGIHRILCGGWIGSDLLLSARTKGAPPTALTLLDHVLREIGHFGGHLHRAGGKTGVSQSGLDADELEREVRKRWLEACGSSVGRGKRLVARKEILRRT